MSMWGGGVAPPRPPSVAPPSLVPPPKTSSNGKRYAQDRQTELEALRQRGLAKLLNRHFTTVTKTIAEDRAAAEAALKDLETRKANTSEFVESTNDGLSIYDKLYKELHQKKAECKRKERETLLLYQRYVDKFGNTGVVRAPSAREMKIGKPPPGYSTLGTPTITRAMYQNKETYLPGSMSPNSSTKVPQMAGDIENELEKHISTGANKLPSAETMGFDETIQSRRSDAEKETAEFNRRALEAKGVDAVYSPSRTRNKQPAASQFGIPMSPGSGKLSESSPPPTAEDATFDDEDEEDDRSAVSGLTSTAASETEARLIDFLKTETASIRNMMDNEDTHSIASGTVGASYAVSAVGTESADAADKAEAMVRQMQKMLHEHESGGEHERSLLDAEHEPYELETPNPQETWIVLWDENYQREYYHESRSGLVQWEKPRCDEDDYAPIADYTKSSQTRDLMSDGGGMQSLSSSSGLMNRRLSRRDVYRLKQRRRRNRRRIVAGLVSILTFTGAYYVYHRYQSDPAFADRMSHTIIEPAERFMGRVVGMERIKEVNNVLHQAAASFMPRAVTEEEERRIREDTERKVHAEIARKEQERLAKLQSQRLSKEEKARKETQDKANKVKKEQARVEAERVAKEQAAHKEVARKEADRQAKENAARKELDRLAEEEANTKGMKRASIKKKRKEAEAVKRREIEERKMNALRRPWHCNIPMSYILNTKCRKLSSTNPVFDLKSLIDAMMQ